MSATNRKLRRAALRYVVNVSSDAQGCHCDRIIEIHGPNHAVIRHDEDCILRHTGRQYMLYKLPERCDR